MKKTAYLLLFMLFFFYGCKLEMPSLYPRIWGSDKDDIGISIKRIAGGYIVCGIKKEDSNNIWVAKLDESGGVTWEKTLLDTKEGEGRDIIETTDGNYVVCGSAIRTGKGREIIIAKINQNGDSLWTKAYGSINDDGASSIKQTLDGGYILTGSDSYKGANNAEMFLLKLDAKGDTTWRKSFGGKKFDSGSSVLQLLDSSYVICGTSQNELTDLSDLYVVMTTKSGDTNTIKKAKRFGTWGGLNVGNSIKYTRYDSGFIITGYTSKTDKDSKGLRDMFLLKLNSVGDSLWFERFGGASDDIGYDVIQTSDEGYVSIGCTSCSNPTDPNSDLFLVKVDKGHKKVFEKNHDTERYDNGSSLVETTDLGLMLFGLTLKDSAKGKNFYLIKTDKDGQRATDLQK